MAAFEISKFRFNITGTEYKIAVESFLAEEKISEPFLITLNLVSEDEIHFNEVIKKNGLLTVTGKDQDRYFQGIINNFILTGEVGRFYSYQATLVPRVWLMGINKNFRIFQEMTTVEIVTKLLEENAISSDAYNLRLTQQYQPRRYCTQYGESDFRFISRILEEEGIYYFFEHTEDGHVLVLADNNVAFSSIDGETEIEFHHNAGLVNDKEVIDGFVYGSSITPGRVTHTNYNFKGPTVNMAVSTKGNTHEEYEIYEYPGNYAFPQEGSSRTNAHLQEAKTMEECAQGTSNCARFIPGCTFEIVDHSFADLNQEYTLLSVTHCGTQPNVYGEYSGIGGDYTYSNSFTAIPYSIAFRPAKSIKKPYVRGIQSAVVTGPPGEEIYPDEYGRVKVQFHWDREGQKNDKSSCWLRFSQPWSGQTWGMITIPRVGDEVLVDFINGDPDWPIIVGSVNNAESPALYSLPANKTQSGIRTRSYPNGGRDNFHELRFEDQKGSEEIYLQSEKDWNILVKNDKGQNVGRDESLTVGNNRSKTVGVNQSESIGVNKSIQVGANHTESIGANMTLSVGGFKNETVGINSLETVGGAKELAIGGLYQVAVGGIMNETVAGAKTEEVGLAKAVFVGNSMTENVKGNRTTNTDGNYTETTSARYYAKANEYVIEAPKITLKAGSSTIVMDGSSITIKASKIFTN